MLVRGGGGDFFKFLQGGGCFFFSVFFHILCIYMLTFLELPKKSRGWSGGVFLPQQNLIFMFLNNFHAISNNFREKKC